MCLAEPPSSPGRGHCPAPRPGGGAQPRSRRDPPGAPHHYPSNAGSQYPPHHQPNGTRSSHNQPDQVRVMGLALRPHLGVGRGGAGCQHGAAWARHGARAAREGRTPAAPCGELTLRWPCGKLGSKLTPASTHQADLVASTAVRSAKRASDDTTNDSDGLGGPAHRERREDGPEVDERVGVVGDVV